MNFTAEELGCPLPPTDLAARSLPRLVLDPASTPLWRIHRAAFGPIFFNRRSAGGSNYRFDAAGDEFGVLYASPSFAGCMAEAVIRERFQGQRLPLILDEAELTSRCVTRLAVEGGRPSSFWPT